MTQVLFLRKPSDDCSVYDTASMREMMLAATGD